MNKVPVMRPFSQVTREVVQSHGVSRLVLQLNQFCPLVASNSPAHPSQSDWDKLALEPKQIGLQIFSHAALSGKAPGDP
jgi:hypothetical protein